MFAKMFTFCCVFMVHSTIILANHADVFNKAFGPLSRMIFKPQRFNKRSLDYAKEENRCLHSKETVERLQTIVDKIQLKKDFEEHYNIETGKFQVECFTKRQRFAHQIGENSETNLELDIRFDQGLATLHLFFVSFFCCSFRNR